MLTRIPRKTIKDVLFMDRNSLSRCSNNDNIRKTLHENSNGFEKEFPHFGSLINTKLIHATYRRKLVNPAKEILLEVTGKPIPDLYCHKILKYLDNKQLKQMKKILKIMRNISKTKSTQ